MADLSERVLVEALTRARQAERKAMGRLEAAGRRVLACRRRTAEAMAALAPLRGLHAGCAASQVSATPESSALHRSANPSPGCAPHTSASPATPRHTAGGPDRGPARPCDPSEASMTRTALLMAAEAAGWPRVRAGALLVGPGEVRWRQSTTLAPASEWAALAEALGGGERSRDGA